MKCTQAQIDALYKVYLQWQDVTPHAIMPNEGVEIVPDEDYKTGDYFGVWVGTPAEGAEWPQSLNHAGRMCARLRCLPPGSGQG